MTTRILIVDDVPFNINLLKKKLQKEYYKIYTASNGKEAIEKAKTCNPDIILMDIMMPLMDGFAATKILKSSIDTMNIPVIMLTALDAKEDKVTGLLCGADDFLTKPFNNSALLVRIRSLLRLKTTMDELIDRGRIGKMLGANLDYQVVEDDFKNSKTLLITQNQPQSRFISDKFTTSGATLNTCDNANLAVEQALNNKYDLIIADTQLMDTDVLSLCFQIKRENQLRYIPIILIIDEHDEETLLKSLENGINDYILFPIDINELFARALSQIKRYKYQEKLRKRYFTSLSESIIDPLTNLYNRRYLNTYVKALIEKAKKEYKPFSLLMLDLDYFKNINDKFGHLAGDQVLQSVSRIMLSSIRATDLCARIGGEEFVIIMSKTDFKDALIVAKRIKNKIKNNVLTLNDGQNITCTVSIGLDFFRKSDNSLKTILERADKNLLKAKRNGRDNVVSDIM